MAKAKLMFGPSDGFEIETEFKTKYFVMVLEDEEGSSFLVYRLKEVTYIYSEYYKTYVFYGERFNLGFSVKSREPLWAEIGPRYDDSGKYTGDEFSVIRWGKNYNYKKERHGINGWITIPNKMLEEKESLTKFLESRITKEIKRYHDRKKTPRQAKKG